MHLRLPEVSGDNVAMVRHPLISKRTMCFSNVFHLLIRNVFHLLIHLQKRSEHIRADKLVVDLTGLVQDTE